MIDPMLVVGVAVAVGLLLYLQPKWRRVTREKRAETESRLWVEVFRKGEKK